MQSTTHVLPIRKATMSVYLNDAIDRLVHPLTFFPLSCVVVSAEMRSSIASLPVTCSHRSRGLKKSLGTLTRSSRLIWIFLHMRQDSYCRKLWSGRRQRSRETTNTWKTEDSRDVLVASWANCGDLTSQDGSILRSCCQYSRDLSSNLSIKGKITHHSSR